MFRSLTQKTARTGLPLWLEISLILIIKVASLFLLWKLFFAQPETKKMRIPTSKVEQHLLTTGSASSTSQHPTEKR